MLQAPVPVTLWVRLRRARLRSPSPRACTHAHTHTHTQSACPLSLVFRTHLYTVHTQYTHTHTHTQHTHTISHTHNTHGQVLSNIFAGKAALLDWVTGMTSLTHIDIQRVGEWPGWRWRTSWAAHAGLATTRRTQPRHRVCKLRTSVKCAAVGTVLPGAPVSHSHHSPFLTIRVPAPTPVHPIPPSRADISFPELQRFTALPALQHLGVGDLALEPPPGTGAGGGGGRGGGGSGEGSRHGGSNLLVGPSVVCVC